MNNKGILKDLHKGINIQYQNFSTKICRNCLSFFIFNLVIGFFISLLFFPIIYYSDLLLSIEENSLYLKSNKDMMFLFLLLYVVILFFVIEFLMKRALESYLLHNNENFDKLKMRGLFTKYFWKRIFFKILILSLIGIISGFFILFYFIKRRLSLIRFIYLRESYLPSYINIDNNLVPILSLVIISAVILVIINILNLRLTNKVVDLHSNENERNPSIKNLLIYGLILFYLIILIKEFELLLFRSYEPFFIFIIVSCSILFGLLSIKFIIIFISLIGASSVKDYTWSRGNYFLSLISAWTNIKFIFIKVLLPVFLFFCLFLYYEGNLSSSYFLFIFFLVILYFVILLKVTLFSDKNLFRKTLKFLNSSDLTRQRRKLLSLVLVFNFLIFWQGTLYFSITETSLDEAFYTVGSDIRISTDVSQVSFFGLDGKDDERIIDSDNRIKSVLRIYINNKHVIQPRDKDIVDLILFDVQQYIDQGYFYREDWFKHNNHSIPELFSTLHNSPRSTIILDSRMASFLGKDIGDKILITPYLGSGDKEYSLTIIGLVDYFLLEYTINQEEAFYEPFALLDIGIDSPIFQTPISSTPPTEKNPTNYWLVNTFPKVDRNEVKNVILSNPSITALERDGSLTVDEVIRNSIFSKNFLAIRQFLGVGIIIEIGLFLLFVFYEINIKKKTTESTTISELVNIDLLSNNNITQINYLSQMLGISFGFVTSIILGSLLVSFSIRLIAPFTPLPIILRYESLTTLLVILYISLLILVYTINKPKLGKINRSHNKILDFEIIFIVFLLIFLYVFLYAFEFLLFLINYPEFFFILITIAIFLINFKIMSNFNFKTLPNIKFNLKPIKVISTHYNNLRFIFFNRKTLFRIIAVVVLFSLLVSLLFFFKSIVDFFLAIFVISVSISLLVLLRYYKFGSSAFHFYLISGKKIFQNKKRLVSLFSGMVLALSLIAGISINVDITSGNVIEDYFNGTNRVSDLHVNLGWNEIDPFINYLDSENQRKKFPWIKEYSSGFTWFSVRFSQDSIPSWEGNPDYIPENSVVPTLSVNPNFPEFFNNGFNLINGTFNLTDNQVVVSPKFAKTFFKVENPADVIGEEFLLFDWLASSVPIPSIFPSLQNINWTSPKLRVSGLVSDTSNFLDYVSNFGHTYQLINNLGVVLIEKAENTFPSFWYELNRVYESAFCDRCPVFEPFVSLNVERAFIDTVNPITFYDQIDKFTEYVPRIYDNVRPFNVDSQIKLVLDEYLYWSTTARVALLLLSSPIIFLGWYIADFSFKHIYFERRKEISSLKSRGINTSHIWGFLILENFIIWLISICLGFLLGITSLSFLDFIFSNQQSDFTISFYTPMVLILSGTILVILGSFKPIKEMIDNPVDELLRDEDIITSNSNTETSRLRNSFIIGLIGMFLILNITRLSSDIQSANIIVILSLTAIGMTVVGTVIFTANISRSIPALLEKIFYWISSYKLFLVTRELKRHGSKTVAVFIVLTLTIGFIVTSQTLYDSTNTYYYNDAYLQVGADLQLKTSEEYGLYNDNKYNELDTKLSSLDDVESVTPFYLRTGYILEDQNNPRYPSLTEYNLKIRWQLFPLASLMFFNISTYFQTAYLQDSFFENDTIENVKEKLTVSYQAYLSDPQQHQLPVIIDDLSATEMNLHVNDSVYFASSRLDVLKGNGTIVAIAKRISPNLSNPFILSPNVFNMKRIFNANNPTSGFLIKTSNNNASKSILHNVISKYEFWPITDGLTLDDILSQERIGRELNTIKNVLLISLFYSLIISSLGFVIVLSLRIAQRSREFGVIKALGVNNAEVSLIIALEASVSIFSALFTGIFIGLISGYLINLLLPTLTTEKVFIINFPIILLELFIAIIFAYIGAIFASYLTNRHKIVDLIGN